MLLTNPMLCHAKTRDGDQCQHRPMHGQGVCHMHGGKAPQNLAKAEERMRALVHPAVESLARQIEEDEFSAVKFVLEWAGFRTPVQVQADQEVRITVVREEQPLIVLEPRYQELEGKAGEE